MDSQFVLYGKLKRYKIYRTPDQLLVFDPPRKFQVMCIHYKEVETYMSNQTSQLSKPPNYPEYTLIIFISVQSVNLALKKMNLMNVAIYINILKLKTIHINPTTRDWCLFLNIYFKMEFYVYFLK